MSARPLHLTAPQRHVLQLIKDDPIPGYRVYVLGRPSCEALRKRGFVEGDRPFRARMDGNPIVRITPAGLAALAALEPQS